MRSSVWAASLAAGLWSSGAVAPWPSQAQPNDEVVLLQSAGLRPELCAALRIQLADVANVSCVEQPLGELLPDRIANGVQQVEQRAARLGVFLERGADGGDVRMYLVAAHSDKAVLAIERIRDRPAPDVDRSLALKVRDTLDSARIAEQVSDVKAEQSLTAAALTRPAASTVPTAAARLGMWLEAGAALRIADPARGVASIALGARYERAAWALELGAGAQLSSDHTARAEGASVDVSEWSAHGTLRVLTKVDRWELGGALSLGALVAQGRGVAPGGERGDGSERRPLVGLGFDARLRLWFGAFLRFSPTLELLPVEQRFAVDERVLYSTGKSQFVLPLALLVQLPFAEVQR